METEKRGHNWEKFDVVATRKDSRKASLFSAPGNLEMTMNASTKPVDTGKEGECEVTKNGTVTGDITLLNNNGKAPKRRLSSYTSTAIETAKKGGRKRSSVVSNGYGKRILSIRLIILCSRLKALSLKHRDRLCRSTAELQVLLAQCVSTSSFATE